jgi:hypothetical protein
MLRITRDGEQPIARDTLPLSVSIEMSTANNVVKRIGTIA